MITRTKKTLNDRKISIFHHNPPLLPFDQCVVVINQLPCPQPSSHQPAPSPAPQAPPPAQQQLLPPVLHCHHQRRLRRWRRRFLMTRIAKPPSSTMTCRCDEVVVNELANGWSTQENGESLSVVVVKRICTWTAYLVLFFEGLLPTK